MLNSATMAARWDRDRTRTAMRQGAVRSGGRGRLDQFETISAIILAPWRLRRRRVAGSGAVWVCHVRPVDWPTGRMA